MKVALVPQVREMAATTLSGFLQCSFLSMDSPMQAYFETLCKTRLPKRRKRELGSVVDTIPSAGTRDCVHTLANAHVHTQTHTQLYHILHSPELYIPMVTILKCLCVFGLRNCICTFKSRLGQCICPLASVTDALV